MSRKNAEHSPISLFPLLAVLICMIGALVLLLLGLTASLRQRSAGRRIAATQSSPERSLPLASLRPPPVPQPGAIDKAALELRRARIEQERMRIWSERLEAARSSRDIIDEELSRRMEEGQKIAETLRNLRLQAEQAVSDADAASVAAEISLEQTQELDAENTRLDGRLALTERKLDQQKLRQTTAPNEFAIIPYDGRSGTQRHPIYIECTEKGYRFLPEDVELGVRELKAGTARFNALVKGTQALLRFWTLKHERAPAQVPKPYILLLVRPGGIHAYDVARTLLARLDVPFGYELLEAEKSLQKLPPDPQAVAVLKRAVAMAVEMGEQDITDPGENRRDTQTWDEESGRPAEPGRPRPATLSGRRRGEMLAPDDAGQPEEFTDVPDTFHSRQPTGVGTDTVPDDAPTGNRFPGPRRLGGLAQPPLLGHSTGNSPRVLHGDPGNGNGQLHSREPGAPRRLEESTGSADGAPSGSAGGGAHSKVGAGYSGESSDQTAASGPRSRVNGRIASPQAGVAAGTATSLNELAGGAPSAPPADAVAAGSMAGGSSFDRVENGNASASGSSEDLINSDASPTEANFEQLLRDDRAPDRSDRGTGGQGITRSPLTNERSPIQKPERSNRPPGGAGGGSGLPESVSGMRGRGSVPNRNLIGLERKIPIRVESDRVLVGDDDPIIVPTRKGSKPVDIVPLVTGAMGRVVDSWGPPPERFYWIPGVRFEVTNEGNAVYEKLRGAFERQKVNSSVDFVGPPKSLRRRGDR